MRASADRGSILTSRWRQSGVCEKISSFRSSGFNVQRSKGNPATFTHRPMRLLSRSLSLHPPGLAMCSRRLRLRAQRMQAGRAAQLLRLPSHGPTHLHWTAPALATCTCMPAAAAAPPHATASVASRTCSALVTCVVQREADVAAVDAAQPEAARRRRRSKRRIRVRHSDVSNGGREGAGRGRIRPQPPP